VLVKINSTTLQKKNNIYKINTGTIDEVTVYFYKEDQSLPKIIPFLNIEVNKFDKIYKAIDKLIISKYDHTNAYRDIQIQTSSSSSLETPGAPYALKSGECWIYGYNSIGNTYNIFEYVDVGVDDGTVEDKEEVKIGGVFGSLVISNESVSQTCESHRAPVGEEGSSMRGGKKIQKYSKKKRKSLRSINVLKR
jgi:hypothetical protein